MSRRRAAKRFGVSESAAIKWVGRFERTGVRTAAKMGGYKRLKLEPHRQFVEALRAAKPDITLQALCDRLQMERGVKADTSLMSRFLRRLGLTLKKRPWSRASGIARTLSAIGRVGASGNGASRLRDWSSSTRPGPRPT